MARVKGPLFSLDASGSVAKTITYSKWKGRNYLRQHVIPQNPQSTFQTNVRVAWDLLVKYWQANVGTLQTPWDTFAEQFQMSGFNQFISRGMAAYVTDLATSTLPSSVSQGGDPPLDLWLWA